MKIWELTQTESYRTPPDNAGYFDLGLVMELPAIVLGSTCTVNDIFDLAGCIGERRDDKCVRNAALGFGQSRCRDCSYYFII